MLAARIIQPMEESEWVNPMMVKEKKTKGDIRICIELWKLNDACVRDSFPILFTNEVLYNDGRQEAYLFIDGFSRYRQIKIASKDRRKPKLTIEWGHSNRQSCLLD